MSHVCPHCGFPLPDEAAFCPHCAQTLRPRKTLRQPIPLRKRVMVGLLVLVLAAAGGVWMYLATRPQVFDGQAEVVYTHKGTTYQLILAWNRDPNSLAPKIYLSEEAGGDFTWPSRWYVNYKDSGLNAAPEFLELVDHVTTEIRLGEAGACPMEASQPAPDGYDREAAMISFIHFICGTDTNQVVWTIHMKNGDVIRLRQDMIITATQTHEIRPEDYPMNTTQELQALVDRLAEEIPQEDQIEIYLPPVTYQEMLVLERRGMNFHGCTDGTGRTAFAGGVQIRYEGGAISFFYDLDFPGEGGGIGLSAASRAWAVACSFANWRTGVLSYGGNSWVNTTECQFADNQIGLHINSTRSGISDTRFLDNQFTGNGTAVVLENVPGDDTLSFDGCVFTENGVDLDNLCGHGVDLSQAVVEP